MDIYDHKWRERFMKVAQEVAQWSKDPATKVGCVIVGLGGEILSSGYNGLPRKVHDRADRMERPRKYLWTAHAEENAVANAARTGTRLTGGVAFVTHEICGRCAGMLINAGVVAVVIGPGQTSIPREEFEVANQKFYEADVTVIRTVR